MGEPATEESEELELRKLPLREATQLVLDGDITDAISAAALLRLQIIRSTGAQ
jgi:hypothetical protein